jgi:rare lipoprotein A (peptidoglycan hydrolase)
LSGGAIVAAPLFLHNQRLDPPPGHGVQPGSRTAAAAPKPQVRKLGTESLGYETPLPTTTSTAPPTTSTTEAPVTTTTAPAPVATTTAPPTPPAEQVADGTNATSGQATWYAEAPAGGCASPSLPLGTEVEVVDDADGATTSCVVDDREATNTGRVVDLSESGFSQLATMTQGVISVTISW